MDESDDFLPEDDSVFEAIVNVTADVESDAIIDDSFSSIQEDEAYFNATSTPMCYKQGSTRRGRRADSPTSSALPVFPGAGHNSPPPLPPSAVDPHSPSTSTRSRTRSRTRCRTPPPIAPAVVDPGSSSMSTRSRTRSRTRCGTPPPIRSSIVDPDSPSMGTRSRTGSRTRCGTPPPIRPPVVDPDSPSMGTRSRAGSRTRAATPTRACPPSPSSLTRSRSRPAAVSSSDTVPVQSSSGLAKSSRIKCSECPESYANERTFKVHKKMHTMKRVFSKVAKPAEFMEKLPSLVSETLDLFLKEMHTGKHAEATRSFMADLKDALSTSEIEEFYEYLHKSLYDILVQHSSVFSSSLVYKFYVGVNVLMNQLEFKDNMKKLFVPCLKYNHQMEVINIGFGHFMHLLSSQVVIYFIRTIHGATAHDEIRRKRSNDSVDSTTFLEMCYYIGGSVVNALLFKAKKFKESNPNWEVFHDVINGRFRRVEGVGNACAPEVSHFTEAVDRGKLIHISQEALDFFVVLFDLLMSLEGRDGSLPVNVVEDNVLEDMSIICLWDVLIGTELDDTASLDFLMQTSTSCKLIVMKGIMKRRLNDNIKKAISSVSLRSRLAE